MGLLGDVFEALHEAPRCERFEGVLGCSRDWDALIEWNQRRGSFTVSSGGAPPAAWSYDVWCADWGRRLRWDSDDTITLVADDRLTMFHPQMGATSQRLERDVVDWPTILWQGRTLLTMGEIVDVAEAEMGGRSAWTVRFDRAGRLLSLNPLWIAGDSVELTVDQASGVALSFTATTADGHVLLAGSWGRIVFDAEIADSVFDEAIPADVRVRTQSEVIYDHLAAQGVDVSGVDPLDETAVHELAGSSAERRAGRRFGTDPAAALEQYVPNGPGPDDPVEAEAAIVAALASFAERDGDDAPHIEQGAGLASILDDAASRTNYENATLSVAAVRFMNDHEAMVIATVLVNGSPLLPNGVHRAVLESGQWKLARSSLAALLTFTGVQLPPPQT